MATPAHRGPRGDAPVDGGNGLSETSYFHVSEETSGFAVHTADVAIDPQTGVVRVERYVVAVDAGRAINPRSWRRSSWAAPCRASAARSTKSSSMTDGQLLRGTLMDYSLPTAGDVGVVEPVIFESHTPSNPLGAKGVGEGGISGSGAAVANAVADALRPLGVRLTELPLTPERVRQAIERARGGGAVIRNEEENGAHQRAAAGHHQGRCPRRPAARPPRSRAP